MSHTHAAPLFDERITRHGSCHCGAVKFSVALGPDFQAGRCNCSICMKIAQTGVIVKPSAFKLLAGEESLGKYAWGMQVSTRHFCQHCGIHCFGSGHLKELGGDFVSPNLNCLDDFDVNALSVVHWDGRHNNWEGGPRSTPWPLDGVTAPAFAAE